MSTSTIAPELFESESDPNSEPAQESYIYNSESPQNNPESSVEFGSPYDVFINMVEDNIVLFQSGEPLIDPVKVEQYILGKPENFNALARLDSQYKEYAERIDAVELPPEEELLTAAKESLRFGIRSLRVNGVGARELLAGGIYAGSNNIRITDKNFSSMGATKDGPIPDVTKSYIWEKPQSAAERNQEYNISLGKSALKGHALSFIESATNAGISLSESDAVRMAVMGQVIHEFGHSIMHGAIHQGADYFKRIGEYLLENGDIPHPEFLEASVREALPRALEIFMMEEFAIHFGILTMSQARKLTEEYIEDSEQQWARDKYLLEFCESRGISLASLKAALSTVQKVLDSLPFGHLGSLTQFSPQENYPYLSRPLDLEELKTVINRSP